MLVMTIAVVVVPQAVEQGRRVAEARRLRGRDERGLRALPPILLPVLAGALERSVQRAESLESRGFGASASRGDWRSTWLGLAGVGLCAWGAFAQYYYGGVVPLIEIAAGVCMVGLASLRPGGEPVEKLRGDPIHARDVTLLAISASVLALVIFMRLAGAGGVGYLAYPEVAVPDFSIPGALAFMLLLAPALLAGQGAR
jgi:energy-coupling factor transport system permease protein